MKKRILQRVTTVGTSIQGYADKIGTLGEKTVRTKIMFINFFFKTKFNVTKILLYKLFIRQNL